MTVFEILSLLCLFLIKALYYGWFFNHWSIAAWLSAYFIPLLMKFGFISSVRQGLNFFQIFQYPDIFAPISSWTPAYNKKCQFFKFYHCSVWVFIKHIFLWFIFDHLRIVAWLSVCFYISLKIKFGFINSVSKWLISFSSISVFWCWIGWTLSCFDYVVLFSILLYQLLWHIFFFVL